MRDAWVWIVLAAAGFLVGQLLASVLEVLWALLSGHGAHLDRYLTSSPVPTGLLLVGEVGLWLGFLAAAWSASHSRGTGSFGRDMGIRLRPWPDIPLGIVLGVASQYVIGLVYLPFILHNSHLRHELGAPARNISGGSHGIGLVFLALVLLVGAPFCEEVLFRGTVLPSLRRLFGRFGEPAGAVGGILGSAVLFGFAHFEPLQFAGLALFGVVLAILANATKRLGPNMIAHAAFNGVALASYLATRH